MFRPSRQSRQFTDRTLSIEVVSTQHTYVVSFLQEELEKTVLLSVSGRFGRIPQDWAKQKLSQNL